MLNKIRNRVAGERSGFMELISIRIDSKIEQDLWIFVKNKQK